MEERYVTVQFCGLCLESQVFILRRIKVCQYSKTEFLYLSWAVFYCYYQASLSDPEFELYTRNTKSTALASEHAKRLGIGASKKAK